MDMAQNYPSAEAGLSITDTELCNYEADELRFPDNIENISGQLCSSVKS